MPEIPGLNPVQQPILAVPAPGTVDFERVNAYRAQILQWAVGTMNNIAQWLSNLVAFIEDHEVPEPTLLSEDTRELNAVQRLLDLSTQIKDRADGVIDGMLESLDEIVANRPPAIDVSALVSLIETALRKELDQTNPLSVYALREVARSYVASLLMNSTFEVLNTDTTQINGTVNAYINRRKSEIDEQLFTVERRSVNELANDSLLDSEIAATSITRMNAKKTRLYGEVDDAAEELRQRLMNEAYERAFKRADARTRAMSLLPLELPAGTYGIIGDVINRQYLDPNAFVSNLPGVIGLATGGFGDVANLLQRGRLEQYKGEIAEVGTYTDLLRVIAGNMTQVADAIGKISTMEAS